MTLNGLLTSKGIDPKTLLVLRRRPWESGLRNGCTIVRRSASATIDPRRVETRRPCQSWA